MTERLCLSIDPETIVTIDALAMADGRSRSAMAGRLLQGAIKSFAISAHSGGIGAAGFVTQLAPGGAGTLAGSPPAPSFNEVITMQENHVARQMAAREVERQAKTEALHRARGDTQAARKAACELEVFKHRTPGGEGE